MDKAKEHRRATRLMEIMFELVVLDVPYETLHPLLSYTQTEVCPHVEYERKHGLRRCYTCGLWHQGGDSDGR